MSKQTSFKTMQENGKTKFTYKWSDHKQRQQKISFALDSQQLNNAFSRFRDYNPDVALRHVEVGILRGLPALQDKNAQAKLIKRPNEIVLNFTGNDQAAINKLRRATMLLKRQSEQAYYNKAFYHEYKDSFGKQGIKADHVRFTTESMSMLTPIAQHIFENYKNLPTREIVNYLLSFVQTIPYQDLEDRHTTHGAGFSPPNRLLLENRGDCDSKSVLMLGILRNLFPNLGLIMVYLPNHALIGIQIPYQKGDEKIEVEGTQYVLAEPTGPALLPVANIAEQSQIYIGAKSYSIESIPTKNSLMRRKG
ncbi:hypothetical protein HR060_02520 [Catenovulum sp. SM1970]|uniref:hypothetical protein n=1 Tax=Marinifaba aquimaris TaxID=2741323 RepID=UPI001571B748|nr:hypothetical protein [Marinifaba aquimaris]NTS75730.1 hypothetical protein [Marinifaba aquimaris]